MSTQHYRLLRGQHVRREGADKQHVFYSADKKPFIWLNDREAAKLKGRIVKVKPPVVSVDKPDLPELNPDMFDDLSEENPAEAEEQQDSGMKVTYTDSGPVTIKTDDAPLVAPLPAAAEQAPAPVVTPAAARAEAARKVVPAKHNNRKGRR